VRAAPRSSPYGAFRKLDLTVQRRVSGMLQGEADGIRLGPGSDAEELVPYTPGHDVRRIDWNATARLGEPHVWLTRAEHELDTWVLVDRTPSMAFGTALAEKVEVAEATVAAIGIAAAGPGNRVGLGILEPGGVRWRPPTTGRRAARRLLTAEPPSPRTARTAPGGATLDRALVALEGVDVRPQRGDPIGIERLEEQFAFAPRHMRRREIEPRRGRRLFHIGLARERVTLSHQANLIVSRGRIIQPSEPKRELIEFACSEQSADGINNPVAQLFWCTIEILSLMYAHQRFVPHVQ
jgi:uncharacterized protein (DUF58 family)